MPWTPEDAASHDKKATGAKARQWAAVANSALERGIPEGEAVREANGAVAKTFRRLAPKY